MSQHDAPAMKVEPFINAASPLPPSSRAVLLQGRGLLQVFLHSNYAPLITHLSTVSLVVSMYALLLSMPLWAAIVPCTLIHYRVGILLHEYIHGIPFRHYKHNLWMLSLFDGLLMFFGFLELFRGSHLAHHRWLNTEKDIAFQTTENKGPKRSHLRLLWVLEGPQHLKYFRQSLRGQDAYVKRHRVIIGVILSLAWVRFWVLVGLPWMALVQLALNLYNSIVSSSMRGAVEHHSHPGDAHFANEYKVWITLFNLNRHIDHHLNPTRPWYLLRFRTATPLPATCYWTHWYHAYLKRDFVLMQPPGEIRGIYKVEENIAV